MRAQLVSIVVIVILAAVAACNDDSGQEPAPQFHAPSVESTVPLPPATSTRAPAAVKLSATSTPVPGPTHASPTSVPFPTATPHWTILTLTAPTATPTTEERRAADERTAFGFINSLSDSVRGLTSAFVVDMEITFLQNWQETVVPASFGGDFLGGAFSNGIPPYSRGVLTLGAAPSPESLEVISVPGRVYVREETGREWEGIPSSVDRTVFPDPRVFVFDSLQDTSHLAQITVVGEEVIDRVSALVVSASSPDIEILGSSGQLDLTYWFSKEDGRLIKVEVVGELALGQDTLLGRIISGESAHLLLTARFFDHGKGVEFTTPELMVGTFSHDATLLNDGRVLVAGGFNAVANNNTLVPFPVSYSQIFEFDTGLW